MCSSVWGSSNELPCWLHALQWIGECDLAVHFAQFGFPTPVSLLGVFWRDLKQYTDEEFKSVVNSLTNVNQPDGGMLCNKTLWYLGEREAEGIESALHQSYWDPGFV
jgi:hypothetical protein